MSVSPPTLDIYELEAEPWIWVCCFNIEISYRSKIVLTCRLFAFYLPVLVAADILPGIKFVIYFEGKGIITTIDFSISAHQSRSKNIRFPQIYLQRWKSGSVTAWLCSQHALRPVFQPYGPASCQILRLHLQTSLSYSGLQTLDSAESAASSMRRNPECPAASQNT